MRAEFGKQLLRDTEQLALRLNRWNEFTQKNAKKVFRIIGVDWRDRAKERVPVSATENSGRLERSIFSNVYKDGFHGLVLEVGTNMEYGVYVEFGTRYIAGGQVLALGFGPEVTDAQAVDEWQAKSERTEGGGLSNDQQMPWLRPAWFAIEKRAIAQLDTIHEPPLD